MFEPPELFLGETERGPFLGADLASTGAARSHRQDWPDRREGHRRRRRGLDGGEHCATLAPDWGVEMSASSAVAEPPSLAGRL